MICKHEMIREYPNGATRAGEACTPEKIRGKRRELKHLSTCRKRKKRSMSLVVASEEDKAQTGGVAALSEL